MKYKGLFIGLTTVDIQYFVDTFPRSNVKIKTRSPEVYVGGPAANAAVAFSVLNHGACFVSAIGNNSFKDFILNDFNEHQIQLFDIQKEKEFSPVLASVITSKNGERNIFTHHPQEPKPVISATEIFKMVNPDIVLIDGFYPNYTLEIIKIAKHKNIPVVADCGSWKPQYNELLNYIDIAICSEDFLPPECNHHEDTFNFLSKKAVSCAAISRGNKSILFRENKSIIKECSIKQVKSKDTLGAGDFLHGAFCYYFSKKAKFEYALKKAADLASFTCEYEGPRNWIKFLK